MVKKQYDKDIKLYLDIVKELKINYKFTLLRYKEFYRIKDYSRETYLEYKYKKKRELNNLLHRLAKRLAIITIDNFFEKII